MLAAAIEALTQAGLAIEAVAPVMLTDPVGPSRRRYANGAVIAATDLPPDRMLALLKRIERRFGRRKGQRWGARVLDCDIVLWSEGAWCSRGLTVPHPLFRERSFVLAPASAIAAAWRDPVTGLSIQHLLSRLTRRSRLPIAPPRKGP